MDTQTLIIAALTVSLAINLGMAIVYWTRRSYPGFGYWLAGTLCRTLAGLLLLLPRDQFPPWLTIILANYLWQPVERPWFWHRTDTPFCAIQ